MAGIVGILGAALQLVDLATQTCAYIKNLHDVPKDQLRLLEEIKGLEGLVSGLDQRIRNIQAPGTLNSAMKELEEPLYRLKSEMERLTSRLNDLSKFRNRFAWPLWGKEEVRKGLDVIERLKTLLNTWKLGIWLEAYILGSVEDIAYSQGEYNDREPLQKYDFLAESVDQMQHPLFRTQLRRSEWIIDTCSSLLEMLRETKMSTIAIYPNRSGLSDEINGIIMTVRMKGRLSSPSLTPAKVEKRVKIIKWYSPLNFFLRHADILNVRAPGTGEWFLEADRFKEWKAATGKILWCRGIRAWLHSLSKFPVINRRTAGAGKTVLVSIVVDHLRADPDCGVAAIYLHHKEAHVNSPADLLASLWRQLVLGKAISSIAQRIYQKHRESHTRPSVDDDHAILCSVMPEYSKVFILVDALDEYPEGERNVLLRRLSALRPAPNLMFTSRPHIKVHQMFLQSDTQTMDVRATEGDIRRFVHAQVSASSRLSEHVINCPELSEEITTAILRRSDGMFLLAKFHIDSLKTKLTVKAVRDQLVQLPRELDSTYHGLMKRINAQDEDEKDLARRTLSWVAHAKRPLRPVELREALAVEPGTSRLDPGNLLTLDTILSVCAGLVIFNAEDGKMGLIHPTAQEYLDRVQTRELPGASTQITLTCITYLTFETFSQKIQGPDSLIPTNFFRDHCLIDYAVNYCLIHARGEPEKYLQSFILAFIRNCLVWRQIWNWTHFIRVHKIKPSASRLWIAAFFHLEKICRYLIQEEGAGSVLQEAASMGDTEMIRLLLENGVDSGLEHPTYGTAIHAASRLKADSNYRVLQLLLAHGADVNANNKDHGSALYAASHHGNYMSARLLLEHGAVVDAPGRNGKTALYVASYHGYTGIGRLLIKHGADVNAKGGYYGTALTVASHRRHYMFVHLLLEHGASVNDSGRGIPTALYTASSEGHDDMVDLLINYGANVNVGMNYRTPLNIASWNGRYLIAQLLIRNGAEVNAKAEDEDGYISTALCSAAHRGHDSIVQLLIQQGADVNAEGGIWGNSLNAASHCGNYESARLLIQNGADINSKRGPTALRLASSMGHENIVRLLMEHGAGLDTMDQDPLFWGLANGHFATDLLPRTGNPESASQYLSPEPTPVPHSS
ncbi:ankyrin repeat-containing domain protein [Mycena crocata]|nr:ankyrin repeat-containing domain protein [Mycena crocata]